VLASKEQNVRARSVSPPPVPTSATRLGGVKTLCYRRIQPGAAGADESHRRGPWRRGEPLWGRPDLVVEQERADRSPRRLGGSEGTVDDSASCGVRGEPPAPSFDTIRVHPLILLPGPS
jgi:hypothetical protein